MQKKQKVDTGRNEDRRTWRINQRAHKFATPTNKHACRKKKGRKNREEY